MYYKSMLTAKHAGYSDTPKKNMYLHKFMRKNDLFFLCAYVCIEKAQNIIYTLTINFKP